MKRDVKTNLTPQQEAFCKYYLESTNAAQAYRRSYNIGYETLPATVWQNASRLMDDTNVAARIKELRALAADDVVIHVRDLLADWVDIARADPNDIVRVVLENCRHCNGINYGYQWKNENEWLVECARAIDKEKPTPSFDGGAGFNSTLPPNPLCPYCFGKGHERVELSDTTKLTGPARKLYAGAKMDRFGCIDVKLHDQQKARESAARMLGAFNDKLHIPGLNGKPEPKQAELASGLNDEQATSAYLSLVG